MIVTIAGLKIPLGLIDTGTDARVRNKSVTVHEDGSIVIDREVVPGGVKPQMIDVKFSIELPDPEAPR